MYPCSLRLSGVLADVRPDPVAAAAAIRAAAAAEAARSRLRGEGSAGLRQVRRRSFSPALTFDTPETNSTVPPLPGSPLLASAPAINALTASISIAAPSASLASCGSDFAAEHASPADADTFAEVHDDAIGGNTHILGCSIDASLDSVGDGGRGGRGGKGGPAAALLAWRDDPGPAARPAGAWGEVEEELMRGLAEVARAALEAQGRAAAGLSSARGSGGGPAEYGLSDSRLRMRLHMSWQAGEPASAVDDRAPDDPWVL